MKEKAENSADLEKQIKELQLEIARLGTLLAFRKMERNHPSLEKLASEVKRIRGALNRQAERAARFGEEQVRNFPAASVAKAGLRILTIGILGYAISWAFGWLENERGDTK